VDVGEADDEVLETVELGSVALLEADDDDDDDDGTTLGAVDDETMLEPRVDDALLEAVDDIDAGTEDAEEAAEDAVEEEADPLTTLEETEEDEDTEDEDTEDEATEDEATEDDATEDDAKEDELEEGAAVDDKDDDDDETELTNEVSLYTLNLLLPPHSSVKLPPQRELQPVASGVSPAWSTELSASTLPQ